MGKIEDIKLFWEILKENLKEALREIRRGEVKVGGF
jgi:hypothetical protein